jgi:hypothetical protein
MLEIFILISYALSYLKNRAGTLSNTTNAISIKSPKVVIKNNGILTMTESI